MATQSTGISIGSSCTVADSVPAGPFCLSVIWTDVRTSSLPTKSDPTPPGQAALATRQWTSLIAIWASTSESSGGLGLPRILSFTELVESAVNPFASGVPIVSTEERCVGGLHDEFARGGPWLRFGVVHSSYAGT